MKKIKSKKILVALLGVSLIGAITYLKTKNDNKKDLYDFEDVLVLDELLENYTKKEDFIKTIKLQIEKNVELSKDIEDIKDEISCLYMHFEEYKKVNEREE